MKKISSILFFEISIHALDESQPQISLSRALKTKERNNSATVHFLFSLRHKAEKIRNAFFLG